MAQWWFVSHAALGYRGDGSKSWEASSTNEVIVVDPFGKVTAGIPKRSKTLGTKSHAQKTP